VKFDRETISPIRFMFTIGCFIQASSLLTSFLADVTRNDSWAVVLIAFAICLPLIWLYKSIMVMFPEKSLIEALEEVFGSVAGKIAGIGYVWFFITLTALNVTDLANFANLTIMSATPNVVLVVMCMAVAGMAVWHGVRVVTQYSTAFVVVEFGVIFSSVLLLANQFDMNNFLPMFDLPLIRYVQGAHILSAIPFGDIVALLMITPNVRFSSQSPGKFLLGGLSIGAFTLFVVLSRDIAVLGNTLSMFTLPGLVSLRLVDIGMTLSRIEVLFAIALIMLLFFKVSCLYYVSVMAVGQVMAVKSYRNIVLAAGALIISYGMTLNPNPVEHVAFARQATPVVWTVFELFIPLLILVVGKLRGLSKTKTADPGNGGERD